MNEQLSLFINGIKEKTGVEFYVYSSLGQLLSTAQDVEPSVQEEIKGVLLDRENNRTLFAFKLNGEKYIGRLNGVGETQKAYALFITTLASILKPQINTLEQLIFSLLAGVVSDQKIRELSIQFRVKNKPTFVMSIAVQNGKIQEIKEVLGVYAQDDLLVNVGKGEFALIKYLDKSISDYTSSAEYAEFLETLLFEETGARVNIGVGSLVGGLNGVSLSYFQAKTTVQLMESLKTKGNVHTYKEFTLVKMLEDFPKSKLESYLNLLVDKKAKEIFTDPEMTDTAEAFLENNLNVSETSRKMYLHRNTLIYRLDKIEKCTGLNIRKFADAVTFRLITILSKITR